MNRLTHKIERVSALTGAGGQCRPDAFVTLRELRFKLRNMLRSKLICSGSYVLSLNQLFEMTLSRGRGPPLEKKREIFLPPPLNML